MKVLWFFPFRIELLRFYVQKLVSWTFLLFGFTERGGSEFELFKTLSEQQLWCFGGQI